MAKTNKQRCELLLPAATGWERWTGPEFGPLDREQIFDGEGTFTRDGLRHVLALPSTATWVLPAWLKGDIVHVRDMAQLHLERLGVRTTGGAQEMQVNHIASDDAAHLACIVALKEDPAPLATKTRLPSDVTLSALCYLLPEDSVVLWRELGRLVVAITTGPQLIYFSPLSSAKLDENALGELNNICLQLGFQRVLGVIGQFVLWTEEGDVELIRRATGVAVIREDKPAPQLPAIGGCNLMPADIISERTRQQAGKRTKMMALGAGALAVVAIAAIALLTLLASSERSRLLDQVAALTPRASRVEVHRKAWEEIAAAVDPKRFPMEVLLRCMEPKSSADVALVHFEAAGDRVMLRGRTLTSSVALQYAQEIKGTESLNAFAWDAPPPQMHSDDSSTFELKGVRQ